jgi:hypothetical protein
MNGDGKTEMQKKPTGKRISRLGLLGLLGAAALIAGVFIRSSTKPTAISLGTRGTDPCDIYLVGVRPDYSDDLFNAGAQRLGKDPPVNIMRTHWNADRIQREFIFEVPLSDSSVKLVHPVRIYLNGHQGYSVKPRVTLIKSAHSTRIVADASLPRLSMRSKSAYARLRGGEPVRTVDINVRFYAGPRAPAEICFSGPFADSRTQADDLDLGYALKARSHSTRPESLALTLEVSTAHALQSQMPLIVYLADGSWKVVPCIGMNRRSQRSVRSYFLRDATLGQLTRITLNEKPWEKTFRQVAVHFPNRGKRTYAPFLDDLAARLDSEVYSRSEAFKFQYQTELEDPKLALRILDVVRGRALFPVSRAIRNGLQVQELQPPEQERIRSILKGWLGTELEAHACALGLWGNWPEFVQPSLEMLQWTKFRRLSEQTVGDAFQYREDPADEEILEVAQFLTRRETKHNPTRQALIRFVQSNQMRPAVKNAWMQMAECDKPWVWAHLVQPGPAFTMLAEQKGLSDTIRLRAVALDMPTGVAEATEFAQGAYTRIATWITPELLQKDVGQFRRVFAALVRHGESQRDTPILVAYLQQQLKFWNNYREKAIYQTQRAPLRNHVGIELVTKLLNQWHGVDLGGLGTDLGRESDSRDHDWMKLIRTVLEWANPEGNP